MTSTSSEKFKSFHEEAPLSSVRVSGNGNEFITIGNHRYYRHELMSAFGGTMQTEKYSPYPKRQFGNAAALGLAAFALTTFVLGLCLSGAMGITLPNIAVGLCFWYGGIVEAGAGIWELVIGNTFAGTVLVSFGMGFWISFGAMNVENFGISAAYADAPDQLNNTTGFFLLGWGIFCFMMLLCTFKSTVIFSMLFLTLDVAFFVLAASYFTGSQGCMTAGGVFCVISACCGWYCAFAGVANKQNTYFNVNAIPIPTFGK